MKTTLSMTHPLTLGVTLLSLLALLAMLVVVIPLVALAFYGSVAYLLAKSLVDAIHCKPQRAQAEKVVDLIKDEPAYDYDAIIDLDPRPEQAKPIDPMLGWTFIPAGTDEKEPEMRCEPVMVCSVDDALAVMDGSKTREEVEFAPFVVAEACPPIKQKKMAKPLSKKRLLAMTDDQLRQLAKEMGCKGIHPRMRRDTILWRITTH